MNSTNLYKNVEIQNGLPVVLSNATQLEVSSFFDIGTLGNNAELSLFVNLIESDEGFKALLNTTLSKQLKAMRDATNAGEYVPIYEHDKDGNLVLKNIPRLSFSPMTAKPDDCCVIAGDLQVCANNTILKELCLEKCVKGIESMAQQIGVAGTNSVIYAAYKQMLIAEGITKANLPTLEQFEQLSLIGQFVVLNMLTFLNGLLTVEQNGNIIRRFNGLEQVYSKEGIYTIDGSLGILEAFKQALCRINLIGLGRFQSGVFIADKISFTAVQQAIVPKIDGRLPVGWEIRNETVTENGNTFTVPAYYFQGIKVVKSNLLYVDETTLTGQILFVPQTVGIFSAVPLDVPAQFLSNEFAKNGRSAFVHWDTEKKAYPDCWSECTRLTNFGAVVSTDDNDLIAITNIKSECDPKAFKGIEGLINVNSYAPFVY